MPIIELEKDTHTYTVEKIAVASVTQILKGVGLIDSAFYTVEGRQIGEAVHLGCEYLDRGTLDWSGIHPDVEGRIRAWRKFKNETGFVPELIEEKVYNDTYRYCGTLDREGAAGSERWLIDIKSGVIPAWAALQTAAYDFALPKLDRPRKRFGVQLLKDGTYKLVRFPDPLDYSRWLGEVGSYYWRANHGLLKKERKK